LNWVAGEARAVRVTAMGGRSGIFAPDPKRARTLPRLRPRMPLSPARDAGRQVRGRRKGAECQLDHATAIEDRNDTCVYRPAPISTTMRWSPCNTTAGWSPRSSSAIFGPWSEDQETLEIVGDSGRLRMERHSGDIDLVENVWPCPQRPSGSRTPTRLVPLRRRPGAGAPLARFATGEPPPVGVAEGVASLRLVHAAQISLRQGGPVDPAELPTDAP
jgi:hypothetical protein